MHLTSGRLHLRRFNTDDAHSLFQLDNDPQVMRYINGGIATPMTVIETEMLPLFQQRDPRCALSGFWAAQLRASDAFIGWFSLRCCPQNPQVAELGYRLRRKFWGAGYATEGARVLIDRGFREHNLLRITATTYEANQASRRVMEKLGLRHCRSFRLSDGDLQLADTHHQDGVELWDGDDVEYELTLANWQGLQRFEF